MNDLVPVGGLIPAGVFPTHLVVVGDVSTSMEPHIQGLRTLLGNLAEATPPTVLCRLALFSDSWHWQSSDYVEPRYLVPGGMSANGFTMLYRTVTEVGLECERLLDENQQNHVLLIVFTDGDDNRSRDWQSRAAKMVQKLEGTLGVSGNRRCWVIYLGLGNAKMHADQAASMKVQPGTSFSSESMDDVTRFGTDSVTEFFRPGSKG